MACDRRISTTFKDVPGGQVPRPTFDCNHRFLDFKLAVECEDSAVAQREAVGADTPYITEILSREGLLQDEIINDDIPPDLTLIAAGFARLTGTALERTG